MDSEYLSIGDRLVGHGKPCYIIAEIGINHNGDVEIARRLIDAAADAGVDAVKFQKRSLSNLYESKVLADSRNSEQALQYVVPLLQEFELSDDDFRSLPEHCQRRGITFLCTAWDGTSVDFLETLNVPAYKIGSPDMTNHPLVEKVVGTGKPVLVSTGMATEDEIRETLKFLEGLNARYGIFHCVSTYPAMADEINLRFMKKLRDWTAWPVGYSGHERGISISLAAVAMGACMLERHLTLDCTMRGPDHSSSLEPQALADQVRAIREIEAAFGVPHRWMTRGEFLNRRVLGKSLVAARDVAAGTVITDDMVITRSPGLGLPPSRRAQLIGRRADRSLRREDPFTEGDLSDTVAARMPHPIDLGMPWGIIARFNDVDRLLERFEDRGQSLIEFHLSDRDLDAGMAAMPRRRFDHDLVVHGPEYCHDHLIDLCASDLEQRRMSQQRLQLTIDMARKMAPSFFKVGPRGPKIVIHVGGMSDSLAPYESERAIADMMAALKTLDHSGVNLLLENLPPRPWFFGGRWSGHILTDPASTVAVCQEAGLGLCFDTSHAALYCNASGQSLVEFATQVRPLVRHLHISDAAGTSGEGLQIGEGQINFIEILPILAGIEGVGAVPEVWLGHQNNGAGFETALDRLTEITWTVRALKRAPRPKRPEVLQRMIVPPTANVLETLRVIEKNTVGTAFVTNAHGVIIGVVTDGDIRRGLMNGSNLRSPICDLMNADFVKGLDTMAADEIRARLSNRYRVLPIVDETDRLVGCVSIYDSAS
jgi:sialic acid synthase SpsE/sugar phosphate isomerase/epimerase